MLGGGAPRGDDDDDAGLTPGESDETVDEAVERTSRGLGAIERRPAARGTELAVAGRPFAVIERGAIEVLLDPAIAAAALRTPDVQPGGHGRGWIRFSPPRGSRSRLDVDRAEAWLRLAHRRALGGH